MNLLQPTAVIQQPYPLPSASAFSFSPQGGLAISYTPPCNQYSPGSGAIVTDQSGNIYANCSANNNINAPQYPPYDVKCDAKTNVCYEYVNNQPTGFSSNSIDGICCRGVNTNVIYLPQPLPLPLPYPPAPQPMPCCRAGGVNECALCLERGAKV